MDTDKAKKILVQQMDRHRKIQKYASEFGNHLMAAEHREIADAIQAALEAIKCST